MADIFKDKSDASAARESRTYSIDTYMEPADEPWRVFPDMNAGKNFPKDVRNLPPPNRGKRY